MAAEEAHPTLVDLENEDIELAEVFEDPMILWLSDLEQYREIDYEDGEDGHAHFLTLHTVSGVDIISDI